MSWPDIAYPSRTRYAIIEALRKIPTIWVVAILLVVYIAINFLFGLLYYLSNALGCSCIGFLNNVYFSFVTGLTIGFGDFSPKNDIGKICVVLHGMISTFYFAMMIAFLGVKVLFPSHTMCFSKKIIYDGNRNVFLIRMINTHRALLINPEIRIGVVGHCHGNTIAPTVNVLKNDELHWLDNHDFTIHFHDVQNNDFVISQELTKAKHHQGTEKSRFKIRISITGSYGMQQYFQVVSYDKDDIEEGRNFKPISYNNEDQKVWCNIRFYKFGKFWEDFNTYS